VSIANLTSQLALFLGLADSQGSVVFNPNKNSAKLSFMNPDSALLDGTLSSMLNGLGKLSDILEFKTQIPIKASALVPLFC